MNRRALRLQWSVVLGFFVAGSLMHAMETDPDKTTRETERKEQLVRNVYRADNWWSNARGSMCTLINALSRVGEPVFTRELIEELTKFRNTFDQAWPAIQAQILAQAGMTSAQQTQTPDLNEMARQFERGLRLDESDAAVGAWAAAKRIQNAEQSDSLD